MEAIHKRIAGIDVHRMKHVITVLSMTDLRMELYTRTHVVL